MRIPALRVAAVAVPVFVLLGLLNLFGPEWRRSRLEAGLPEGYGVLREMPEYVIYGELANRRAAVASEVLEAFTVEVRREFGEMLSLSPPQSRFDVLVFSSHADLATYGEARFHTDFDNNGGFYQPSDRLLAVIDRGDVTELVRALFHEGTHLMLDTWVAGAGHDWSLWLNEGLATWFEGSRFDDRRIELGGLSGGTLAALRRGRWIPLARILGATPDDYRGGENSLYYAQSCLLVAWLMRPESRERFAEYFEAERRPGPVRPGTFEAIVGNPDEVEGALREWLRTRG